MTSADGGVATCDGVKYAVKQAPASVQAVWVIAQAHSRVLPHARFIPLALYVKLASEVEKLAGYA